jgi:glycosyltransferase involved in cell wall biosynthesis
MAEIPGKVSSSHAPRVSVVIPTYNRARELGRCLDSLVAQSYRDFEVLVCDDGSTDETATVAAAFDTRLELTYHWAENFGGPARPRNIGLNRARGIYVAFLDSDDWWAPRKLEMSVPRLDAGSDVVYHDLREARSTRQRLYWRRSRVRRLNAPVFQDLLLNGNALNMSSIVMRRDLLLRAGGFSEHPELIAWEDYDAWLQVAKLTDRFERLDEPLGYYWAGGGNISTPQRLIDNLRSFKELYIEGDRGLLPGIRPPWFDYTLGLSYYRLGHHANVAGHMRRALAGGLPAAQRAKAVVLAAVSMLLARGEPVIT